MQLSHTSKALSVRFDEPNLVVSAGLVPAVALAQRVGLGQWADAGVRLPGPAGANAGAKVMSLVAGMTAGASWIDDMGLLRHGAMQRLFTGIRAPSTLGTFLRTFSHGHVSQLESVARKMVTGLAAATPLLPGIAQRCLIDIDDTIKPVYGRSKQAARFGRTRCRGLNAQIATLSTDTAAPVIAATQLRNGAAASATGAPVMVASAIGTARRAGADGPILVRADSGYYSAKVVHRILRQGAQFSIAMKLHPGAHARIQAIPAAHWTPIEYPWAIPDPDTGELISAAEVAETSYTAFAGHSSDHDPVTARMIVRRVPLREHADRQPLFRGYRYYAIFTNNPEPLIDAEKTHRGHAVIEQVIADLKASALAHLPSAKYAANAAWLTCAAIAFNLTRALAVTTGALARAETATIRTRLINIPARVASSARRIQLHLPRDWIWHQHWLTTWHTVTA